jgi:hypothetical protein
MLRLCRPVTARIAVAAALAAAPALAQATEIRVAKTSGCGCCVAWMEHVEAHGFTAEGENLFGGALVRRKLELGVPPEMASCHTAEVEGYVIEGHVPAEDIRRLLDERPDAIGLAVPEMPLGSPGMDFGSRSEPYAVHLIRPDGSTEVFARHE